MNKKFLRALALTGGLVGAGSASAAVVGGIFFEDLVDGAHFENTTLYETVVQNIGDVLTGYGMVTSINGNDASVYGSGTYRLFFTFEYTVSAINSGLVEFDSGSVNIYRTNSAFNLQTNTAAASLAYITGGTLWASMVGHDNIAAATAVGGLAINASTELYGEGAVLGSALDFSGSGLLDINGGLADVVAYLDSNGIADIAGGFADLELTTAATSTNPPPGSDCSTLDVGETCVVGSANLKGKVSTVPEPGSLALLGLGVLGLGAVRRNRKSS